MNLKLEEREARLQAILDTAVDGIITIDRQGIIESFNRAAERIFLYRSDEVIGKNIRILMPEPDRSAHDSYLGNYHQTHVAKIIGIGREVVGLRKDGTHFPLDLAISEVKFASQTHFSGIVRDITERKKTEVALKQSNEDLLEKTIALEEATRLKSEFLANMSHELRTPMNAIIGFTGRVIKKGGNLLPERQLKNLRTVERNAHHLLNLINSLLDLSKIEAGKMEVYAESFSLRSLVSEVMDLTQSLTSEKGLEVITDLPDEEITLHTDKMKLKQILINLISNATKFTEEGSITIGGRLLKKEEAASEQVALSVKDTGIGMAEDEKNIIFEAFRQVDGSVTRKAGGTGLGLAITKRFTELLQGTLAVESVKGEGSVFRVTIPRNIDTFIEIDEKPAAEDITEILEIAKEGATILCIDDDPEVIELLRETLSDEGFHVISALSGDEGIRQAKACKPLAITLDIQMPHKDGWTVLSELKADPQTRDIPVIISTMMDNRRLGYQLGAVDFLQKPILPKTLLRSIKHLLCSQAQTVLVVDDDPEIRNLTKEILEEAGMQVRCAQNGLEALASFEEVIPDLILLDLMMPLMDGFETVHRLKENPLWEKIPVIVISAKTLTEQEHQYLNQGITSIMKKGEMTSATLMKQIGEAVNKLEKKGKKG